MHNKKPFVHPGIISKRGWTTTFSGNDVLWMLASWLSCSTVKSL